MFPISTITDIDESRPCLLDSNYFTLCNSPYLTLSFGVKPASCGGNSLQTVVPDEFFHFVKSKLAHWVRVCTGGFSPNTCGSRYTLPEVPFITVGSCQYTPLIPLRGVIGQARHIGLAIHKGITYLLCKNSFLIFLTYIL